ncbi:MAG: 16S rRNA (cytosine(1402)-N(4))-methyltransferase, partial [Cyanobacteria bacterium J06626_18]
MPEAVLEGLQIGSDSTVTARDAVIYLDATVGGGGHSARILAVHPTARVVALDQDRTALAAAQECLAQQGDRVTFHYTNFAEFDPGTTRFHG